jgi:hypothetical protein
MGLDAEGFVNYLSGVHNSKKRRPKDDKTQSAQNDKQGLLIHFHPKIISGLRGLHWANFLDSGGSYGRKN